MPATFPGSHNTFVPNHEATGKLVVDFSRNPNRFRVNKYAQIVPVKQDIGLYLNITVEEAGRIINTDLSDFVWPDGNDAPSGADGTESFQWLQYRCERYAYAARLGNKAIANATWELIAQHAAVKAQQAMTARTQKAVTLLTTGANWDSTHTAAVSAISGNTGTWAASTTARQDIKRSLNHAANLILKDTLAAVDENDLDNFILVLNPVLAASIAQCQEIVDHVKGSPEALAQVRGELPGGNTKWGLPDKLYGYPVVVENAVKTTSKKGATAARSFIWGDTSAAMVCRPGGLVGAAGAPSFSTVTIFVNDQEEMVAETKEDTDNKRTNIRVIDGFDVKLTAGVSGFLFTSAG